MAGLNGMKSGDPSKTKICLHCGRSFSWRKKWEDCWDEVRFCSQACRKQAGSRRSLELEAVILELLKARSVEKSICPSEAARHVAPDHWRDLMTETHHATRRLARAGKVKITRKDKVVDPDQMKGPVRLRLS